MAPHKKAPNMGAFLCLCFEGRIKRGRIQSLDWLCRQDFLKISPIGVSDSFPRWRARRVSLQ